MPIPPMTSVDGSGTEASVADLGDVEPLGPEREVPRLGGQVDAGEYLIGGIGREQADAARALQSLGDRPHQRRPVVELRRRGIGGEQRGIVRHHLDAERRHRVAERQRHVIRRRVPVRAGEHDQRVGLLDSRGIAPAEAGPCAGDGRHRHRRRTRGDRDGLGPVAQGRVRRADSRQRHLGRRGQVIPRVGIRDDDEVAPCGAGQGDENRRNEGGPTTPGASAERHCVPPRRGWCMRRRPTDRSAKWRDPRRSGTGGWPHVPSE